MTKKGGGGAGKSDDWSEMQERMTRAIISELRSDLEDLLAGLDAGSLGYIDALKALKIQLLEGLDDPLVGAVEVKYRKINRSMYRRRCGSEKGSRRGRSEEFAQCAKRMTRSRRRSVERCACQNFGCCL